MTVIARYDAMLAEAQRIQGLSDAEMEAERDGDESSEFYVFRRLLIASGLPGQLAGAVETERAEIVTLLQEIADAEPRMSEARIAILAAAKRIHKRGR